MPIPGHMDYRLSEVNDKSATVLAKLGIYIRSSMETSAKLRNERREDVRAAAQDYVNLLIEVLDE